MFSMIPLRTRSAVWILLPAVALIILYAGTQANLGDVEGYWVGVASSATTYAVFSCGFGALTAAMEGSRVRKAKVMGLAPSRSALAICAAATWPSLLLGLFLQTCGLMLSAGGTWGAPGQFPWWLLVAWAAMITFHVVVGYYLGLLLPGIASAPLALLVSYVWLGFTWSVGYVPLRYLSGLAISGCCTAYAELDGHAIGAVSVFSAGGVIAVGLAIVLRGRPSRLSRKVALGVPAVPLVAGTVAGLALASGLGPYPSPPRNVEALSCSNEDGVKVCFFPEQLWKPRVDPVLTISEAASKLEAAGMVKPDRVSGSLIDSGQGNITMLYRRDFTKEDILHSFSSEYGYVSPERYCQRDELAPERLFLAADAVTGLVYEKASGGSADPFISSSDVIELVRDVQSMDEEGQVSWLNNARAAIDDCSLPLPRLEMP